MSLLANLFGLFRMGAGGTIEVTPEVLRETARIVERTFTNIDAQLDIVQSNITALNDDMFDGRAADEFRVRYITETRNLKDMTLLLQNFRNDLLRAADKFEAADRRLAGLGQSGSGGTGGEAPAAQVPAGEAPPATTETVNSNGQIGTTRITGALNEFDVEHNKAYLPRDGKTYCNIFAADFATAMGAEIPKTLQNGQFLDYLNANEMVSYLAGEYGYDVPQGEAVGWHELSTTDAARYAQDGYVVVVGGGGHMGIVRPESMPTGNLADMRIPQGQAAMADMRIAQAGASNFNNGPLLNGFGSVRDQVRFFVYKP